MPLLYGEGEKAFARLQEEIMKVSDDFSLFAWRSTPREPAKGANSKLRSEHAKDDGLLASSPAAFVHSGSIVRLGRFHPLNWTPAPLTVSNKGIHLTLPIKFIDGQTFDLMHLNCTERGDREKKACYAILITSVSLTHDYYESDQCHHLALIDVADLDEELKRTRAWDFKSICVRRRNTTPHIHVKRISKRSRDGRCQLE